MLQVFNLYIQYFQSKDFQTSEQSKVRFYSMQNMCRLDAQTSVLSQTRYIGASWKQSQPVEKTTGTEALKVAGQ